MITSFAINVMDATHVDNEGVRVSVKHLWKHVLLTGVKTLATVSARQTSSLERTSPGIRSAIHTSRCDLKWKHLYKYS